MEQFGLNSTYPLLTPEVLSQHKGKKIYVHGISGITGVTNDLLDNSGSFTVP